LEKKELILSVKKSKIMIFKKERRKKKEFYNGTEMEKADHFIYLRYTL